MELLSIDRAEFCPFRPAAIFLRRQKSSPSHRSPGRRGSKSLFYSNSTFQCNSNNVELHIANMLFECCANFLTCDRRSGTQSAVLSEVLNGTDHLRGVGVLVVVPRHDLNLIGVVAATLNFCTFPSSSSQFCNNSYSTRPYRCRTKTGLFAPKLYHVSASFARFPSILHPTCIFLILGSLFSRNT